MAEAFDTPTVGINILIASDAEENEHGFSNREIGITYPFGEHMMGDTLKVNPLVIDRRITHQNSKRSWLLIGALATCRRHGKAN